MNTKLSCIMFTDIFGFSQMMETSESTTIEILEHHNSLVFPIIGMFQGNIVDTVGDGLLVLFDSALSAVNCAVAIQKSIHEATIDLAENRRFQMRIGLHIGDIWYNENRVYGNGVNIASRIESQALPGGICISEDMYHQVANKLSLEYRSVGAVPLKNIERAIHLYHIVTGYELKKPEPELVAQEDERRRQLLEARERIRTDLDQARQKPDSPQAAIEKKALSFADKVMDKAIAKWESLPEDKKMELISKDVDDQVTVSLGNSFNFTKKKRKKPKGFGELIPLSVFLAGFGTGIFHFGIGWMWAPFILFGIGFLTETADILKSRSRYKEEAAEAPRRNRQLVLDAASSLGGKITAVKLAAKTGLDLDDVQRILDDLAARGYIAQHLMDSGAIYYEFIE